MAQVRAAGDYYAVLQVVQTASLENITQSYRRLARKYHPDKNLENDTTATFQLLQEAYDTLRDNDKRRQYDLVYSSIKSRLTPARAAKPAQQSPVSSIDADRAEILQRQQNKYERDKEWRIINQSFERKFQDIRQGIQRLEQEIRNLRSIEMAEAAEEAQKNSWGAWLLSPFYTRMVESDEDRARKQIERQERRLEKDMKERRLAMRNTDLKNEDRRCQEALKAVITANNIDDNIIQGLQDRIRRMMNYIEQESRAKQQQEKEKIARETLEALRKRQAEEKITRQRRAEEELRNGYRAHSTTSSAYFTTCLHKGFWPKVQGRRPCPRCGTLWTYLLQCPSECGTLACPKCQKHLRPSHTSEYAKSHHRSTYNYNDYDF